MAALARELKAQGKDIISLIENQTLIHLILLKKLLKAIDENYSTYSPVEGYGELKAIYANLKRQQFRLQTIAIVVSTGAKQSLYNIAQVMLNDGDEVILPAPYWVSYFEIVKLSWNSVEVPTSIETDFKITQPNEAAYQCLKRKMMWFSSPCNPSGSVYREGTNKALAAV
jgi:aspartate aminotransferase